MRNIKDYLRKHCRSYRYSKSTASAYYQFVYPTMNVTVRVSDHVTEHHKDIDVMKLQEDKYIVRYDNVVCLQTKRDVVKYVGGLLMTYPEYKKGIKGLREQVARLGGINTENLKMQNETLQEENKRLKDLNNRYKVLGQSIRDKIDNLSKM